MKKLLILFASLILISPYVFSQDDKSMLTELLNEDKRTIEALALYPESTKRVILEAATYPDALARMESIRGKTQESFQDIIAPFDQDVQIQFYELSRYPELMERLVVGGKKSRSDIKDLLTAYPEEIHDAALKLGRKRYGELSDILELNRTAYQAFESMIGDYPIAVQSNLRQLLEMPEVLDVLMNNFESTVMMGAIFKRDPDWVWHVTDSIQMEIAKMNAEELADWKANLEEDPEALKELESAAESYAAENGYDSRSYRTYLTAADFRYWYHFNYVPYSYWFGYPYWYAHPFWYPRPYWYYWGFYYGPGGSIVIFDFPSWYFVDWYFARPYHHYYYPHLSNRYLTHYERHRTSSLSTTTRIRRWTVQNRDTYSRDWLRNDDRRVERLKDFGARQAKPPATRVPTYTRPSIQRPPAQRRPTDIRQPATRSQGQDRPSIRDKQTKRPTQMRAPEYHEQKLQKRTPTRVSPTQGRKPTTAPRVAPRQKQKTTTRVKKRN